MLPFIPNRNKLTFESPGIEKIDESINPRPDAFWIYPVLEGGEQLQVTSTFSGSVQIDWGDSTTDNLISGTPTTHTY